MPSVKPQWVKPSTDLPFPEAVKVQATVAIAQNQIVVVSGAAGGGTAHFSGTLKVKVATAAVVNEGGGRLLVAKHAIPSGEYGVCVPWRLITMDTTGLAVGNPMYLGTTGNVVAPSALAAGSKVMRQVGTVAVVGNATTGRVLLAPESPASAPAETIDYAGGVGGSEVVWEFDVDASGDTTAVTIPFPVRIIDAWTISEASGGSVGVKLAGNTIITLSTGSVGSVVRATAFAGGLAHSSAAAGAELDTVGGSTNAACKLYVKGIVNI